MNKYQKYLLENMSQNCYLNHCDERIWSEEKLILKQNEDITINDYVLRISNANVERIYTLTGDVQTPFEKNGNSIHIPIDFEHKIDSIKIVFKNNLADDLTLPVEYVEADKEAYYAKQEKKRKDDLLTAADIKCSTGTDLVNIYFQPCCIDYSRTEIFLYHDGQMLAKYKVDEDVFFKSISGLAFGKYEFVLKQYNDKGKVIMETNKIAFLLNRPNYGGKPTVVI